MFSNTILMLIILITFGFVVNNFADRLKILAFGIFFFVGIKLFNVEFTNMILALAMLILFFVFKAKDFTERMIILVVGIFLLIADYFDVIPLYQFIFCVLLPLCCYFIEFLLHMERTGAATRMTNDELNEAILNETDEEIRDIYKDELKSRENQ